MYEIWDGDLFLYCVDTVYEADEATEAGFVVKQIDTVSDWLAPDQVLKWPDFYRHLGVPIFLTSDQIMCIIKSIWQVKFMENQLM